MAALTSSCDFYSSSVNEARGSLFFCAHFKNDARHTNIMNSSARAEYIRSNDISFADPRSYPHGVIFMCVKREDMTLTITIKVTKLVVNRLETAILGRHGIVELAPGTNIKIDHDTCSVTTIVPSLSMAVVIIFPTSVFIGAVWPVVACLSCTLSD